MANEIDKIYDNAFIYMLTINEECYIGSTFDFNRRMNDHKNSCYNENGEKNNFKIYKYIRENGGWSSVNIRIIDVYYLVTKKFKIETEQYYMEYFRSSLNSQRAYTGLDRKEYKKQYQKKYYENNTEKIKQQQKEYSENNKEKIKQRQKQWNENNIERIKEYQKQWYENNTERIKEYKKQWHENNTEKIKQQTKQYYKNNTESIKEYYKKRVK